MASHEGGGFIPEEVHGKKQPEMKETSATKFAEDDYHQKLATFIDSKSDADNAALENAEERFNQVLTEQAKELFHDPSVSAIIGADDWREVFDGDDYSWGIEIFRGEDVIGTVRDLEGLKRLATEMEKRDGQYIRNAAKNLAEGGLPVAALQALEDPSKIVDSLKTYLRRNDLRQALFPSRQGATDQGGGEAQPGTMPQASIQNVESMLYELRMAGFAPELLEDPANRPLVAIRVAEEITREVLGPEVSLDAYREGMTAFYRKLWKDLLGTDIEVPPLPKISAEQHEAFDRLQMLPVYFPEIAETEYPSGFTKPRWYPGDSRIPLTGEWVMMDSHDLFFDGAGMDPVANAIGLTTRFGWSWDQLRQPEGIHERIAAVLHLKSDQIRLPTVEEANLYRNLAIAMAEKRSEPLLRPKGSDRYEWTENASGDAQERLRMYDVKGDDGLFSLQRNDTGNQRRDTGFHVVAVLR